MATVKEKKIKRHNLAFLAERLDMSLSRFRKLTSGRGAKGRKISLEQMITTPIEQLKQMISGR